MMKPGMPQPGMQSMPYPQPAAPQAPLPPYLQALFPSGLPPMATLGAGQATQVMPGQMQSPQLQDLGQLQPMSQMSLPPYLQALFPSGLPSAQVAPGMPSIGRQVSPMPKPYSNSFMPFSFLGGPSNKLNMP